MDNMSKAWENLYKGMKDIVPANLVNHPVIKQAIAVSISYDFASHYGSLEGYVKKLLKNFKEHVWLVPYANTKAILGEIVTLNKSSEQYILQLAYLIKSYPNMDGLNILEIGGGFGGMARILLSAFPEINSYTLMDFPPMLNVAKAFLAGNPKMKYIETSDAKIEFAQSMPIDLVISNYCLTETTEEFVSAVCEKIFTNRNVFMIDGGKNAQPIQKIYLDWLYANKDLSIEDYPALAHQNQKVLTGKIKTKIAGLDANPNAESAEEKKGD